MALADAYCSVAEYRSTAGQTDTADDADVEMDLLAVSRHLERELGRFFNLDVTDQTRLYVSPRARGIGRPDWAEAENPYLAGGLNRTLHIDDLVTLTSITIDENRTGLFTGYTALAATDYELLPRNATAGPEARPYTSIELTTWGARFAWTPGVRVQIIGRFGWPAVPIAIRRACLELTRILRIESPRATRRVDELGTAISTSKQAQDIITRLYADYRAARKVV